MNYDKFYEYFFAADKYRDAFQKSLLVVPFETNTSRNIYDKSCGIIGVTGEFFRLWLGGNTAIQDVEQDVIDPVKAYLEEWMDSDSIPALEAIVSDIMQTDEKFNVIDTSFFKYVPTASSFDQGKRLNDRYRRGQERIAEYIYSMVNILKDNATQSLKKPDNLFCRIIHDALGNHAIPALKKAENEDGTSSYYILPFVKSQFNRDLDWILSKHRNNVTVKYIPLLLHYYACFSLMQIIPRLNYTNKKELRSDKPLVYYYMLSSEHATSKSAAVEHGWSEHIGEDDLTLIFGKVQCLDILNILLEGPVGMYPEVLSRLQQINFEEEKESLQKLLATYQDKKRETLRERQNADKSLAKNVIDCKVDSSEEFVEKLYYLCTNNHPADYKSKFRKGVLDLMRIRLLENRRGYWVLTLDDEMLLFMVALVTKEQRTKVDDMYKKFADYGICFNMPTRSLIEKYLLKLNLLDRKSDSGEAQYVRVVL